MSKSHASDSHFENRNNQIALVNSKMDKNMDKKAYGLLSVRQWSQEKILTTVCLFLEMTAWGMYIGVMNSSILDLELVTNSSTTQISFIWTAFTVGSGFMGPIAGFLLDKSDSRLYMGLAQVCCGILAACLPLAGSFIQIMGIAACEGIFLGLLDIGRNITAVKLWGWDGAMWLQFFHFIFAVGAAISPLYTKPFLAMPLNGNNTAAVILPHNDTFTEIMTNTTQRTVAMSESRIQIPFAIVGGLWVASGLFCFIAFVIIRKHKVQEVHEKKERLEVKVRKQKRWYVILMVVLLFFRFFFIVGIEVTLGALQLTFLVKGLGWTKSDAVMAVFTLRVTFAVTRGLGVGLASFITPTKLMFIDIVLLIISFSLMWTSSFFPEATWIVWLSTGLAGSGVATFYSASMSWAEKYLQISGRLGGFFLIGSACGVLAFPPLAGYLFETYTPWSFVYVCFGITVMLLITTIASAVIGQWYRKRHPYETNIEIPELNTLTS